MKEVTCNLVVNVIEIIIIMSYVCWGPEGWGPERWGPGKVGFQGHPKGGEGPEIRAFFLLPPQISFFLPSLGGLLVEFWCLKRGPLKCARLEFSGSRVSHGGGRSGRRRSGERNKKKEEKRKIERKQKKEEKERKTVQEKQKTLIEHIRNIRN